VGVPDGWVGVYSSSRTFFLNVRLGFQCRRLICTHNLIISLCEFAFATVPKRTTTGAAGVRSRFPVGAARGQGVDGISRHATWALGRSWCTRVSADVVRREPSGSAWDMYGKDADGGLLTPSAWHGGVMGVLLDRSGPHGAKIALLRRCCAHEYGGARQAA
jgi:hypothetical protein